MAGENTCIHKKSLLKTTGSCSLYCPYPFLLPVNYLTTQHLAGSVSQLPPTLHSYQSYGQETATTSILFSNEALSLLSGYVKEGTDLQKIPC
jgi:hypothetical protein